MSQSKIRKEIPKYSKLSKEKNETLLAILIGNSCVLCCDLGSVARVLYKFEEKNRKG